MLNFRANRLNRQPALVERCPSLGQFKFAEIVPIQLSRVSFIGVDMHFQSVG